MSETYRDTQAWVVQPEPEQLFHLTSIVAATAKTHGVFKSGRNYDNARFMMLQPTETVYTGELSQQLEGIEHKVRGHIRRLPATKEDPYRKWSLVLRETFWTTHTDEAEARGTATTHRFTWSDSSTITALRRVVQLPSLITPQIDDIIDTFHIRDDEASIAAAENEIRFVSRADCDALASHLLAIQRQHGDLQHAQLKVE